MRGLLGIQSTPPDIAVDPPTRSRFSRTSASRPLVLAASAPAIPPPPLPIETKSVVKSHSVIAVPPVVPDTAGSRLPSSPWSHARLVDGHRAVPDESGLAR